MLETIPLDSKPLVILRKGKQIMFNIKTIFDCIIFMKIGLLSSLNFDSSSAQPATVSVSGINLSQKYVY